MCVCLSVCACTYSAHKQQNCIDTKIQFNKIKSTREASNVIYSHIKRNKNCHNEIYTLNFVLLLLLMSAAAAIAKETNFPFNETNLKVAQNK